MLGVVPSLMPWLFAAFGLIFLGVLALIVTILVRSRRVLRDAGLDPLAAEATLAARVANLLARRKISPEEHARARARILSE